MIGCRFYFIAIFKFYFIHILNIPFYRYNFSYSVSS